MVPPTHLLSGYLAGRLLGALSGDRIGRGSATLHPFALVAMVGAVAPDFDTIPALLVGWEAWGWHRTMTHSLLGSLLMAPLLGSLAYFLFGRREKLVWLSMAGLLGISTHIAWDAVTPWGVQVFWPSEVVVNGNLVHSGDFIVMGMLGLSCVTLLARKPRWALVLAVACVPSYLAANWAWRCQA